MMEHFIKTASGKNDSLLCEAQGLTQLAALIGQLSLKIKTPEILSVSSDQLVLDYIPQATPSSRQMRLLGEELAKLHLQHYDFVGAESDNYIGLSKQLNPKGNDWGLFFYQYRLLYQVSQITEEAIRVRFQQLLGQSKSKLIALLNQVTQFSLLHGDLWAGNVMYGDDQVWLIDPAVYYGDAETDIAMSEMFGGFSTHFYQGYQSIKALSNDYEKKKLIYNLYHYLNHYNLFGSSYLPHCRRSLDAISQL